MIHFSIETPRGLKNPWNGRLVLTPALPGAGEDRGEVACFYASRGLTRGTGLDGSELTVDFRLRVAVVALRSTVRVIFAPFAVDAVVTHSSVERVFTFIAIEGIHALVAGEHVVPIPAINRVGVRAP